MDPADAGARQAVAHYRQLAGRYDHATRRIDGVRRRAVQQLALRPGEVVLDCACGTGFCFAPILAAIGPGGHLIGFDVSPDLLALADARLQRHGWRNVTLIRSTATRLDLAPTGATPVAALFSYTHDLLQSDDGLDRVLAQLAPGARVAACGTQLYPRWLAPANAYLRWSHRHYITRLAENFDRPWRKLATRLRDFTVQRQWPGERYIATGRLPG